MIEFTRSFKTSDGNVFGSLELAQTHELKALFPFPESNAIKVAETLVAEKAKVIDILTTTATSRPRARKAHGGTKKRSKPLEGSE